MNTTSKQLPDDVEARLYEATRWITQDEEGYEKLKQFLAQELHHLQDKHEQVLSEIENLIAESSGVYGLHLNGDPADWQWLIENGWLEETEKALTQNKTKEQS